MTYVPIYTYIINSIIYVVGRGGVCRVKYRQALPKGKKSLEITYYTHYGTAIYQIKLTICSCRISQFFLCISIYLWIYIYTHAHVIFPSYSLSKHRIMGFLDFFFVLTRFRTEKTRTWRVTQTPKAMEQNDGANWTERKLTAG